MEFGFSQNGFEGEVPDYLLEKNQTANQLNLSLYNAILAQSVLGVEAALNKGASVNYFHRPEEQKNALHLASEEGFLDIVHVLLKTGDIVIDAIAAPSKTTALILASTNAHNHIMTALIEANANVNMANMYGNTALHEAARSLNIEGINILLRGGAKIIGNKKDSTPLHFVCYEEKDLKLSVEVAELLINTVKANEGEDAVKTLVNAPDYRGMTPLLVCCTTGNINLLKLLKSEGADVKVTDLEGRTALKIAEFYGKNKLVEILGGSHKPHPTPVSSSNSSNTTKGKSSANTSDSKTSRNNNSNNNTIRTSKSASSSRKEKGGAVPKVPLKSRQEGGIYSKKSSAPRQTKKL